MTMTTDPLKESLHKVAKRCLNAARSLLPSTSTETEIEDLALKLMATDPFHEKVRKKARCCLGIVQSLLPDMAGKEQEDMALALMYAEESKLRVVQQALQGGPEQEEPDDPYMPQTPVTHDTKLPWE